MHLFVFVIVFVIVFVQNDAMGRVRRINPRYWTLVFPTDLPGITTAPSFHKKHQKYWLKNAILDNAPNFLRIITTISFHQTKKP